MRKSRAVICETCDGEGECIVGKLYPTGHHEVLDTCPDCDGTGQWDDKELEMSLPVDKQARKEIPIYSGVLAYFPDAIAEVARVSLAGNKQHHADKPLHWDRSKSGDHADCVARHLIDQGNLDDDGQRHSAKLAWRALALLQIEIEDSMKGSGNVAAGPSAIKSAVKSVF